MPYNLPPPWDPGYALPDNVVDEGLQRRALITKQMPRGTYDQPKVGTGGYVVPQYVMDEGYGQGTFTTKWMPSGTYVGPKIPHWLNQRPRVVREKRLPGGGKVVTVQAMGDDAPMPVVFDTYGRRAADAILSRVSMLPPGQREVALRAIMNHVDKSLWSRTQTIAKRYLAQRMPPAQAFAEALARALSTGLAAELIDTGLRRTAPQANSLLGLGCYGRAALGATRVDSGGTLASPSTKTTISKPTAPGTAPAPVGGVTVSVGGFPLDPFKLVRAWSDTGQNTPTIASRIAPPDLQIEDPAQIPPEAVAFLRGMLLTPMANEPQVGFMSTNPRTGFPEPDRTPWFGALGIDGQTLMNMHPLWWLRTAVSPFARVQNVLDGSDMALHVQLATRDPSLPPDPSPDGKRTGYTNPLVLKVWLSHVPDPSLWTSIWKGITYIPMMAAKTLTPITNPVLIPVTQGALDAGAAVASAVKDGLNKLGDLACQALATPGVGAAAGAAGGVIVGVPPTAGAAAGQAGAQIAKGACGGGVPPPLVPRPSVLPLAILAGGAVLAVALLTKKKAP